jgi:hypothetical protein
LLATVARETVHELDASVGAPGPYSLTVREGFARLAQPSRPSLPASHFVTIGRNVPLHEAGWRKEITISDFQQQIYFCGQGLNARKQLRWFDKIEFSREPGQF